MWFFPLAFLTWTLVEIGGFIAVGRAIGLVPTLALVVASGALGGVLLRFEGVRVLRQTFAALNSGKRPDLALAHAGLTALGGLLLILPGFFSDVAGLALFLRPVRSGVIAFVAWLLGPYVVVETRTTQTRRGAVFDLEPEAWRRSDRPETPPPVLDGPDDTAGTDGGGGRP